MLTTTLKNAMLSAVFVSSGTNTASWASLHTGDPSTSGANEAGSVPRQNLAWSTPSGSSVTQANVTFTCPVGTYTWIGYWDASTGGTFLGGYELNPHNTFIASGQLPIQITETMNDA